MRWMIPSLFALLLSFSLWAVPAAAAAKKSSPVAAKTAKTSKSAKAGKPAKALVASRTNKPGKKPGTVKKAGNASQKAKATVRSKSVKASKTSKTTKSSKTSKTAKAGKTNKAKKSAKVTKPTKAQLKARGKSNKPSKRHAPVEVLEAEELDYSPAEVAFGDHASERIYDGLLPTVEEKIVMPVMKDENGRAECVQLLKSLMAAPRTLLWKEGRKLKASWDRIQPGTAIATFRKGRYPQKGRGPGNKHAAIFLRASHAGIYVFDQFAGKTDAEERFIPWHHPRDPRPSNNAAAYSTVRW